MGKLTQLAFLLALPHLAYARGGWGDGGIGLLIIAWMALAYIGPKVIKLIGTAADGVERAKLHLAVPVKKRTAFAVVVGLFYGTMVGLLGLFTYLAVTR